MATSHLRICKARRRGSEGLAVGRRWHLCADAGMSQAGGADARTRSSAGYPAAASPRAADLHTAASRLHNRAGLLITAGNHMRTSSLPAEEGCWVFFLIYFFFLNTNDCWRAPPPPAELGIHSRSSAGGQVDWSRASKHGGGSANEVKLRF